VPILIAQARHRADAPARVKVLGEVERAVVAGKGWKQYAVVKFSEGNASLWIDRGRTVDGLPKDQNLIGLGRLVFSGDQNLGPSEKIHEVFLVAGDAYKSIGHFRESELAKASGWFNPQHMFTVEPNSIFAPALANRVAEEANPARYSLEQTFQHRQPQVEIDIPVDNAAPGANVAASQAALQAGLELRVGADGQSKFYSVPNNEGKRPSCTVLTNAVAERV
jgi:hypothetical protein